MAFYHTKNEFGSNNLELITKKGVYSYDYMDDFNKYKEEGLPSIENLYSKSTGEDISDKDYNFDAVVSSNRFTLSYKQYHRSEKKNTLPVFPYW